MNNLCNKDRLVVKRRSGAGFFAQLEWDEPDPPEIQAATMKICVQCQTELEQFEIACHSCGFAAASGPQAIVVSDIAPSLCELSESYESWMQHGRDCLKSDKLEEACNALREAVRRSRVLDSPQEKEIEARKYLAEALEKLGKTPEAADQYRIMAQEAAVPALKEHWLKKSQDLLASSSLAFDQLFRKEEFRSVLAEELRFVPLYCSGCRRLLAEAEVYGFRRGLASEVRCWCGVESRPLAKEDNRHRQAYLEGQTYQNSQRARAIQIASAQLSGGKKQSTACLLAFATGFVGGHKFYLGEATAGWIYLFWFWTLVPLLLSIYEGIVLLQMNPVTFNMTYNFDLVLSQTLPEEQSHLAKLEIFSLDAGEGPDLEEVAKNGTGGKEV